mmetsp:Transcript_14291/g.30941  ORF Transcript_14291/g.30941 Transcript_14291/m.30941 type:complete len:320 (-) Transcript_14291:930-1889(-)
MALMSGLILPISASRMDTLYSRSSPFLVSRSSSGGSTQSSLPVISASLPARLSRSPLQRLIFVFSSLSALLMLSIWFSMLISVCLMMPKSRWNLSRSALAASSSAFLASSAASASSFCCMTLIASSSICLMSPSILATSPSSFSFSAPSLAISLRSLSTCLALALPCTPFLVMSASASSMSFCSLATSAFCFFSLSPPAPSIFCCSCCTCFSRPAVSALSCASAASSLRMWTSSSLMRPASSLLISVACLSSSRRCWMSCALVASASASMRALGSAVSRSDSCRSPARSACSHAITWSRAERRAWFAASSCCSACFSSA